MLISAWVLTCAQVQHVCHRSYSVSMHLSMLTLDSLDGVYHHRQPYNLSVTPLKTFHIHTTEVQLNDLK